MTTDLLSYVQEHLASYEGTLADLSRATGVKESWLAMFRRGKIENPGVLQVQTLAAYFRSTGRRARVAA